jgi:uncharacterized protein YkwD
MADQSRPMKQYAFPPCAAVHLCAAVILLLAVVVTLLGGRPTVRVLGPAAPIVQASPQPLQAAQFAEPAIYLPVITTDAAKSMPSGRQAAVDLYNNEYLPSENVAMGWTGDYASCNSGDTSAAFKSAVLRRINYYRAAAGVPPIVGLNATYNRKAQAAALLMSRNTSLSHSPPSGWPCYSDDAKEGAGSGNLALGQSGPDAISGYMMDPGAGNTAAGHRRWVLHPQMQEMGTGDVPRSGSYWGANNLYVFDGHTFDPRPAVRDEFVAWPPKGFVPYRVVFQRWSFGYPGADFNNAQVTVTLNGASQPLTRYAPQNGYGENTLVWAMNSASEYGSWAKPAADATYVVTVRNVIINGTSRDFTYDVVIIDP